MTIIGSDREGLGIGLGLGIRIADLNQIADLNLTPCLSKLSNDSLVTFSVILAQRNKLVDED